MDDENDAALKSHFLGTCVKGYIYAVKQLPVSSLFAARWYWIVFCVTVTCCFLAKSFSSGLQRYPHGFSFFSTFVFNQFLSFFFSPSVFFPLHLSFSFSFGWEGGGGVVLECCTSYFL